MRGQHQPVIGETAPVRRAAHPHRHAVSRDGRISQVILRPDLRDAAVFDPVRFVTVAARQRRISRFLAETDAVGAAHKPQVGHRREEILALVIDDPRIREVEFGGGGRDTHHRHAVLRVEHREADLPFGLCRAFGDPDQHPDLPVVTEYTGIQQAFDLHRGLARTQIFGAQDRVMCVAHGQWFFCNSKVDYIPRRIVYNTTKMV